MARERKQGTRRSGSAGREQIRNQEPESGSMSFMPAGAPMTAQIQGAAYGQGNMADQRELVAGLGTEMARDGYVDRNLTDMPFAGETDNPVRSPEAEEAFQLGQRMGAEGVSELWGDGTGAGRSAERLKVMTKERIMQANLTLQKYKDGKQSVDRRVIRSQEWWKMRNWNEIEEDRGTEGVTIHKSATAWLWNCIVGKHADAMDSFPEPVILPRMEDDKAEAKKLSDILPVVLQINGFEDTYSKAMWQKYLEGTGCYGVFWDKTKMNGMGDISIKKINMLNLFWEPGITDIEESRNVFYVSYVDNDQLEGMYPQLKGKLKGITRSLNKYKTDDSIPLDNKSEVVDWYYHKWVGPKKILHYCKYVGEEVLYSTEDQGDDVGLYEDGEYPYVLDPLFPVEGSPAGYGYIDIGKDAQEDIDTLNHVMVINTIVSSVPRYIFRKDGGINEQEFADLTKLIIHANGSLGTDTVLPLQTPGLNGNVISMLQQKIDELKFVTGNTDVNNGGTPSGVTAASAIAALREDSGRSSKDSNRSSYRSANKVYTKSISRIRQFYTIPRQFRILGQRGEETFVSYSNNGLKPQKMDGGLGLEETYRVPAFDIEVRAQRENAFTKISQNELALQLYNSGMFNPQMSDQVLMCLDMMDFKGKDEVLRKVQENGTMQEALMQVGNIALALAEKYQPEVAEQLAAVLQGVAGEQAAISAMRSGKGMNPKANAVTRSSDATDRAEDANQNANVRRARERSIQASRPN